MIPSLPAPFNANVWLGLCLDAAPLVPLALLRVTAACLANPKAGSDELLFLADALEETAQCAAFANRAFLIRDLRRLADLPRSEASIRARVGPATAVYIEVRGPGDFRRLTNGQTNGQTSGQTAPGEQADKGDGHG